MTTHATISTAMAQRVAQTLIGLPVRPLRITWRDGAPDCTVDAKRSLNQNALLHKWFGEIADHFGDVSPHDMKGICHREYGLPIRLRDNQFAWVWERSGAGLVYEKQCAALASGVFNVSSGMTTIELKEYLDEMQRVFVAKGVRLTIPEER